MMKPTLVHSVAMLAGIVVAFGVSVPSMAQAPGDRMAECQALYNLWSRYDATPAFSPDVFTDAALGECLKGNYDGGLRDLELSLRRNRIPLPPSARVGSR